MALSGANGGGGSSGAVRMGGAYVELGTRDNKLIAGLKAGAASVAAWAAGTGLAAGAVLAKSVGTLGDLSRIGEIAQATGAPVEKLSGLFGVMEASGQGIKESIESVSQFGTAINDAIQGKGENAADLFKILGTTAQEFKGLDIAEGVFRLFEALEKVNDPLEKTRALGLAFGTDGMKLLLPMLNKTSAELRQQAQLYAVSAADVGQARQATLAYAGASAAVSRAWRSVAVTVAPVVEGIADAVNAAASGMARIVTANRDVFSGAFVGAEVVARLAGLGPTIDSLTAAWKSFGQAVGSGELGAAAGVAMAALDVEFSRGLTVLASTAEAAANVILDAFRTAADGIRSAFQQSLQQVAKWLQIAAVGFGQLGIPGGASLRTVALGLQVGGQALPSTPRVSVGGLDGAAGDRLRAAEGALRYARLQAAFRSAFSGGRVEFGNGAGGAPGFVGGASRGGFLGGGPSALSTLGGSVPQQQLNELKKLNDKVGALPKEIAAATQLRAT